MGADRQPRGRKKASRREEALLAEVQRLREVIAEITGENLQLKWALALAPRRRYTAVENQHLLEIIRQMQDWCPDLQ